MFYFTSDAFFSDLYSSWKTSAEVLTGIVKYSEDLFRDDVMINRNIGTFGARHILEGKDGKDCQNNIHKYVNLTQLSRLFFQYTPAGSEINILTHCNTGSLATAGYGTALGVIRALNESGRLTKAYCTETRPYNQGSRLTAYELVYEKIPSCLICDDMAGALMNSKVSRSNTFPEKKFEFWIHNFLLPVDISGNSK